MYAIDFKYDGRYLSDYGFIVCDFDGASGVETVNTGSKLSFEKISRNGGKKYTLASAKYTECITCTFDICKDPDKYDADEREITSDEYRDLMMWLNRKDFHEFKPYPDKEVDQYYCHYNATFNIEAIKIAQRVYGLRLTMETDSPFGYGEKVVETYDFPCTTSDDHYNDILIHSDEIGFIYPDVEITYNGASTDNLRVIVAAKIYRIDSDGDEEYDTYVTIDECCDMHINNCRPGETIRLFGDTQIITTDNSAHKICSDFDYDFFKLSRDYDNNTNKIYVSNPCTITISYYPIVKNIL